MSSWQPIWGNIFFFAHNQRGCVSGSCLPFGWSCSGLVPLSRRRSGTLSWRHRLSHCVCPSVWLLTWLSAHCLPVYFAHLWSVFCRRWGAPGSALSAVGGPMVSPVISARWFPSHSALMLQSFSLSGTVLSDICQCFSSQTTNCTVTSCSWTSCSNTRETRQNNVNFVTFLYLLCVISFVIVSLTQGLPGEIKWDGNYLATQQWF